MQPFTCTNCGAKLTWRDAPVIECDYCHTRMLVSGGRLHAAPVASAPAAKRGPNKAVIVIVAAVVAGIVVIALRAGGKRTSDSPPAAPAVAPTASVAPPKPVKPAEPPKAPSIAKQALAFGEAGTNAGQLDSARAIAVTADGSIVIAEARTGRAQVFDAAGAYQRVITLPPSALTKELTVFGAGAAPDGSVVVSRAGDLLVLDPKAGTVTKTIRGDYPDVFYHDDVEVVPDGSIWAVTDRTGDKNLVHVSAAGKIVAQHKNIGVGHVAVDGVGTIFMTKDYDPVVEVRDAKGAVQRKFSQAGATKLSRPGAIAYDGKGHLFVADGDRVLVFDPEGAFLGDWETGSVDDLALDRAGAVYTLARNRVTKWEVTLPAKP